ncbi:MAG: hypothetical protein KatS3mg042_0502 [Rhodothermaceae bacterium]|nr:MAG: hypothetical protein KatS3mg042_0502 [Rhodothermaceae bacterium]
MMRKLSDLKMGTKLVLLVMIPLAGLIVVGGGDIVENQRELREGEHLVDLIALARQVGQVLHDLQHEQGVTVNHLEQARGVGGSSVAVARRQTDEAVEKLNELVVGVQEDRVSGELREGMMRVLQQLEKRSDIRNEIDQGLLAGRQMVMRYAELMHEMVGFAYLLTRQTSDADLTRHMTAYVAYMQIKEPMGMVKSLLSRALGAGRLSDEDVEALVRWRTQAEIAQEQFERFAPPVYTEALREALREPEMVEGTRILDAALRSRRLEVDRSTW